MRIQQTLTGTRIILYPFKQEYISSLRQAAEHDDIWTYNKAPNQNRQTFLDTYFKQLQINQEKNTHYAYVVAKQSNNTILGSTRFYDISEHDKRLAIGFTWYSPSVWGTYVNAETKLLLLQHVFESLDFNRVEFHVDSRNKRSLNAMKKLGATEEGLLRQHKIVQGDYIRDTILFSIITADWRSIQSKLKKRLRNEDYRA